MCSALKKTDNVICDISKGVTVMKRCRELMEKLLKNTCLRTNYPNVSFTRLLKAMCVDMYFDIYNKIKEGMIRHW